AKGKSAANIVGGSTPPLVFAGAGASAAGGTVPRATTTCRLVPSLRSSSAGTSVVARLCAPTHPGTLNLSDAAIPGTFVAHDTEAGHAGGAATLPSTTTTSPTSSTTSTTSSTTTSSTSTTIRPITTSTTTSSTSSTTSTTTTTSSTTTTTTTSSTTTTTTTT